ncbi:hypothetical protein H9P43_009372 [Blastocladiella emersonii ATCC 22665]|nr:hypothetical protein H9P43_009372 [Blastocladiella emersonii ATCC 22665]
MEIAFYAVDTSDNGTSVHQFVMDPRKAELYKDDGLQTPSVVVMWDPFVMRWLWMNLEMISVSFELSKTTTTFGPQLITRTVDEMCRLFNEPLASDVQFLPGDATEPIYASRAILIPTSPFFDLMFRGEWSRQTNSNDPIKLPAWPRSVFILALVHLYTKWLPGVPLPESIKPSLTSLSVDLAELDLDDWRSMAKLAGMLECIDLASAAQSQAMALLGEEFKIFKSAGLA